MIVEDADVGVETGKRAGMKMLSVSEQMERILKFKT